MQRPTREKSHELLKPSDLNLWFGKFNHSHPLLADDCALAVIGTEVSWEKMFLLGAVRTDAYRKLFIDIFGSGNTTRNLTDQVSSGAIVWSRVDDMKFLQVTDDELKKFDALWSSWITYRNALLKRKAGDGDRLPAPVPAEPSPSKLDWWVCKKCSFYNETKDERCFRCFELKLKPTTEKPSSPKPDPKPTKPEEPSKPIPKPEWLGKLKASAKMIASVLGIILTLGFLFIPAPIKAIMVTVKSFLELIINNL